MTCAEFQEVLPELMEGERSAESAAHLQTCPTCSELVSDLDAMVMESRQLKDAHEPSPRVWLNIESELRREGLIREPQPQRILTLPHRRWAMAAWLAPVAAALILSVAFFLKSSPHNQSVNRSAVTPAISTPVLAEEDQQVVSMVAGHAPAMEAAYKQNLQAVDAYISDAQKSVDDDPDDDDARQALMAAQEQKAMIYEMALDHTVE